MSNDSKISSKLVEKLESSSPSTSTRSYVTSDHCLETQTIGNRFHRFILTCDHLGIDDVAQVTNLDPAPILEAALTLAFLNDTRAWEGLMLMTNQPPEMDNIDNLAVILDSWYSQYKSAMLRTFSFIKDFLNVTDVVMVDGDHVLIEVIEEYDLTEAEIDKYAELCKRALEEDLVERIKSGELAPPLGIADDSLE